MSKPDLATSHPPTIVRPKWGETILVCGKCAKRHTDGKALRRALKEAARRPTAAASGERKGRRKTKIVKTACLGLCPKNAVVVASGATLAAGEVILLRDERDVGAALLRLLPQP